MCDTFDKCIETMLLFEPRIMSETGQMELFGSRRCLCQHEVTRHAGQGFERTGFVQSVDRTRQCALSERNFT